MKNLMLYIDEAPGQLGGEKIKRGLDVQIDNSLELGWRPEDILLYTNFPYSSRGVAAREVRPGRRPRTARMTSFHKTHCILLALAELAPGEVIWYHDLDAFQIEPFDGRPSPKDLCACVYSARERLLIQGGSMFITREARPLFERVFELLVGRRYRKDEAALTDLTGDPRFLNRFGVLDYSFNLGDTDFELRYQLAQKPIRVVHFHPERREHLARFLWGRNSLGVLPLGRRFSELLVRHGFAPVPAPGAKGVVVRAVPQLGARA